MKAWQDEEEARVVAISVKIVDYTNKLAAAKDSLDADTLGVVAAIAVVVGAGLRPLP